VANYTCATEYSYSHSRPFARHEGILFSGEGVYSSSYS
jgi:hypothetical protein